MINAQAEDLPGIEGIYDPTTVDLTIYPAGTVLGDDDHTVQPGEIAVCLAPIEGVAIIGDSEKMENFFRTIADNIATMRRTQ